MVKGDKTCDFSYCQETLKRTKLLTSLTRPQFQYRSGVQDVSTLYYAQKLGAETKPTVEDAHTPQRKTDKSKRKSIELDVTGSPLKADFDPEEEFDMSGQLEEAAGVRGRMRGPVLVGLEPGQARTLLSRLNGTAKLLDLRAWALCTPTDNLQTLYLGSEKRKGRVVSMSTITWAGPIRIRELGGLVGDLRRTLSVAGKPMFFNYLAEYSLASGPEEAASCRPTNWLRLSSDWYSRSMEPLLEPPPQDARAELRASLGGPGHQRLAGSALYSELETLRGLLAGLTEGQCVWNQRGEGRLDDEVLEVLEAASKLRPTPTIYQDMNRSDTEEMEAFVEDLKTRQDVDFTDMLWTVLSRAGSYEELKDALNLTLVTMAQQDIRPFIYAGNRSGMAGIVESLRRGGVGGETLPELTGSQPLLLTIEMGLEKLRRDYSHALLSTGLASQELVSPFLGGSSLVESVELVGRLQLAVELATACRTFLPSLSPGSVKYILYAALTQLMAREEGEVGLHLRPVLFKAPIHIDEIKSQLDSCRPDIWQLRVKTDRRETVVQLQVDLPEELLALPNLPVREEQQEEEGDEGSSTEPDYHMFTLATSIRNTV